MRLGILAAMSLVHGGGSCRIFGKSVYRVLTGKNAADLVVCLDEVPDGMTKRLLQEARLFVSVMLNL